MKVPKDSDTHFAQRRAVRETILLSVVFLIALALFFLTIHFLASKEVGHKLQNRPWGLTLGWFTTLTIGLILGKTRQADTAAMPKSIVVVREALQAVMLLLFFGVLCYASYFFYTSRILLQRPWGIFIGWFAFLMFLAFFGKTRQLVRIARRK